MCDETKLMGERYCYVVISSGSLTKGLRVCDVCSDTVIVRRSVCTVENSSDSFQNICYIYRAYTKEWCSFNSEHY